ncbi:tetratricopeptide repeat protein [Aureibacter tunicatorum]|uniref:Tetratricopeptide (TPR) repeat protein n=1 Tax=Aureibacter tunicatorum TaxID=866807 RepID=A0AAE4BSR5_9BACT|nr:tetratricopeptide repeat protein [Aureibacter tunicatorum]MDR6239098.1 tetratricopeptide (TPR) repeat protein [Aureibacter tunicatorum]BDD04976.1 hypothetical protein AUTU_24590 [Aureibacter tunicatorum]
MNKDRIEQLQNFLKNDPNDPFLLYALATEYKSKDKNLAKKYFDKLLVEFPDYCGTYFHAAALYADFDEIDKAKNIYEEGISRCEKNNEQHHLRELKNAYNNFLIEFDLF